MRYMRAHGNSPGPTHRPLLTGAISAQIAAVPSILIRYWTGALESEARALGIDLLSAAGADLAILLGVGILYSLIFKRAANDLRGGWLFGISYGFLIWVVGPVSIWQWVIGRPLATGVAAMGIFGAQLAYGLVLGSVFPFINKLTIGELK
jgi:hypothetical protein